MAVYLVTGGAGFIGANIVKALVAKKQKVVVLDNLSTGNLDNLKLVKSKIRFIRGDIRDFKTVKRACAKVDYVLHQAALRAVPRSIDEPLETNEVNITGTLNVLLASQLQKVKRVVFASSSSVYGDTNVAKNIETQTPAPVSPYALSKLTGEHYCRIFHQLYSLETVSLRYFNVFGPHQNPESKYSAVIPVFVNCLMRGKRPEVHWQGKQSRDFTYVENVVEANLLAARAPAKKAAGKIYNIANGMTVSINELIAEIQGLLETDVKPIYKPKRPGDILRTFADISRAKKDLGYQPIINFKQGLEKSIEWYKENL